MVQRKANDYQVGGDHYKSKIEHWDYVEANKIPYLEAMVIKYLTRWRKKGGARDLRKAQHFMQKLFEVEGIPWEEPSNIQHSNPLGHENAMEAGHQYGQLAQLGLGDDIPF